MIIFSQQLANYESLQCPRKLFDLALNIFNSRHGNLTKPNTKQLSNVGKYTLQLLFSFRAHYFIQIASLAWKKHPSMPESVIKIINETSNAPCENKKKSFITEMQTSSGI